jgi:quercetin dioxygenase-like cupin family protein
MTAEWVDAGAIAATGDGVQWTLGPSGDLNANVVHLDAGHGVGAHVNDEVDVLLVVLAGSGTATVDGSVILLAPGVVVHLPRGSRRRVDAGDEGLRHLTVHRRRGPLSIGRRR